MKLPNRMSFPLFKAIFWHTALPNQVHRHYTPGNPNQVACNMTMHTKDDNMHKKRQDLVELLDVTDKLYTFLSNYTTK